MSQAKHLLQPMYLSGGAIAVGHRLSAKVMPEVKAQGVTHIVTLLSEKEGASDIQREAQAVGLNWIHVSMANAQPPYEDEIPRYRRLFSQLQDLIEQGNYLYIHCSAGIHRTGMITNALFRYMGFNAAESFSNLETLRQLSSQEAGLERLRWGNHFSAFRAERLTCGKVPLSDFLHLDLIGCTAYAHSIGEGYQYRGTISRIYPDGAIRLVNVETTSNEECDIDFTDPYRIQGDWQPYEDFSYGSEKVSVELTEHGFIIDYWYVGSVYIHCPLHILQQQ